MRNILVATDFSQHAYGAAVFAARLARHSRARLILFHAYQPAVLSEEEALRTDKALLEQEVQEKIDGLAHALHLGFGVSVTRLLIPGFPVDELLAVSQKVQADLVVIGAWGAGKRIMGQEGNVATGILEKAPFPVICLPPETTSAELFPLLQNTGTEWKLGNPAGLALLKTVSIPDLLF
jgi:nucleotide-binding universal stress UspA family protein